jgi:hypothetical protein
MRFSRWNEAKAVDSDKVFSTKAQELQTAKEILAEVFHVRPVDVDDMILSRLEEKSWREKADVGLWPATFWLGE